MDTNVITTRYICYLLLTIKLFSIIMWTFNYPKQVLTYHFVQTDAPSRIMYYLWLGPKADCEWCALSP